MIYAALASNLGLTPEQSRRMPYVDYLRLARGWRYNPPPSAMLEVLARINGWKPQPVESDFEGNLTEALEAINAPDENGNLLYGDVTRFLSPSFKAQGAPVKSE